MNTIVLVAMIVIGLSLVLLALKLSGSGKPRSLSGPGEALEFLRGDYPEVGDGPVVMAADGSSAVLLLPGGLVGIVRVMGRHVATRLVDRSGIASVSRTGPAVVSMAFAEFGWSAMTVRFADEETADRLVAHLGGNGKGRR
ncbi:hypothetical protein CSC94_04645 [Zhengella mangrovi]|uniref:Uncharacterized protein n=1 Tax=Zhengella mangrovi TaxID=1982044 RepID=A0A2G1QQZ2_9HYPH|nr:hypothetical protein [Zhengella mangrovi]PHP67967.1 hypothetical protein CSC94_04645 [Zhengella mangrovi]